MGKKELILCLFFPTPSYHELGYNYEGCYHGDLLTVDPHSGCHGSKFLPTSLTLLGDTVLRGCYFLALILWSSYKHFGGGV